MKEDLPTLDIELGLSPRAEPSLADFVKRCRERLELMVSGRADLEHLVGEDVLWRSKVVVKDEHYQLVVPIEPREQPTLEGFHGKRARAARVKQQVEAMNEAVERTIEGVQASAKLTATVAETMATSPDARRELRHLEHKEGVDTGPARRFIQQRQGDFFAHVEATAVPFRSVVVRTSQLVDEEFTVVAKLIQASSAASFESCQVLDVEPGKSLEGVTSGGRKALRFADLASWQRMALCAAREFGVPIHMRASNRIGTCSLEFRAADVTRVDNWRDLVAAGLVALGSVQFDGSPKSSNDESAEAIHKTGTKDVDSSGR